MDKQVIDRGYLTYALTDYDKDMLGAIEYCIKNNRPLEKEHIAWLEKQKPAEWSEEDEKRLSHVISFLEDKDRWKDTERAFPIEEDIMWLKSLSPQKQ